MSHFGDFEHHLQVFVGDSNPNIWVMFNYGIYQPLFNEAGVLSTRIHKSHQHFMIPDSLFFQPELSLQSVRPNKQHALRIRFRLTIFRSLATAFSHCSSEENPWRGAGDSWRLCFWIPDPISRWIRDKHHKPMPSLLHLYHCLVVPSGKQTSQWMFPSQMKSTWLHEIFRNMRSCHIISYHIHIIDAAET